VEGGEVCVTVVVAVVVVPGRVWVDVAVCVLVAVVVDV
jgi:hypothetical protein